MWAVMRAERIGPVATSPEGVPRLADLRWSLLLTVDCAEGASARDQQVNEDREGVVAVDLGWRMRADGCRVGYWVDDSGHHEELVLPENVLTDLEHARSIGAIRRRNANEMQTALVEWRAAHVGVLPEPPEWFVRATATLASWKSANRLTALAWRWRDHRFDGDEEMWVAVEAWRRQDRHLAQWEANETDKVLARRNEQYKRWAAIFARNYRHVVIEKFNLPEVAGRRGLKAKATDGEKVFADNASSRRHMTAPGIFRLAIVNACRSRSTEVHERPAAFTTLDCWKCGFREDWDTAPTIDHRCGSCGATWDQDYSAAVNLRNGYVASDRVVKPAPRSLARRMSARQQRFRGIRPVEPPTVESA
jgi:hypothetical protein